MATLGKKRWASSISILLSLLLVTYFIGGASFALAEEGDAEYESAKASVPVDYAEPNEIACEVLSGVVAPCPDEDVDALENETKEPEDSELNTSEDGIAQLGETSNDEVFVSEESKPLLGDEMQTAKARAPLQASAEHGNVITSIEAVLQDGSGPVDTIGPWQIFRLLANFSLPDYEVHEGDTTTITLPDKLKFNQTADFDIASSTGDIVAHAAIDGPSKTIALTYTAYPETHSLVSGNFYFYVQIERLEVDEAETIPLIFNVSGETLYGGEIQFTGLGTPDAYEMAKSGWQMGNDGTIRFQLSINTAGINIHNAVLTDHIRSPGLKILPESLVIYKGTWVVSHGEWALQGREDVTSQYPVSISDDLTSLSIDLGDIDENDGFQLRYDTKADYTLVDGEVLRNNATLAGNDTVIKTISATATYLEAGGSAEGYVYTIKIVKTDAGGNSLTNAQFEVVRAANGQIIGTIATNAAGEASITGLLKDTYLLIETAAPEGYAALLEPITVTASDFHEDKTALVSVVNETEKTNITIEKRWIGGPAAESVTIDLMVGDEIVDTVMLDADSGWTHTFENLDKYRDGIAFDYRVAERALDGYSSEVIPNDDGSFTIYNTNVETVDVVGSKTWEDENDKDGIRPTSIVVHLMADGAEVDTATVNEDAGWSWLFSNLPKYDTDDGHEIRYSINEDETEGYTATYKGHDITNTHTPTPPPDEPITPTPEKPTDPTPSKPNAPTPDKPTFPSVTHSKSAAPQTSDRIIGEMAALFGIGAIVFAIMLVAAWLKLRGRE